MFCLIDKNNAPIAFHKERRVIEYYQEAYYHDNKVMLDLVYMKKKNAKKYSSFDDLYLVRYGRTFIQSKYLYIRQLDLDPLIEDLQITHDVMIRLIEFTQSSKDVKQLSKALNIVDENIDKLQRSITSIDELKERDMFYDEYRCKTNNWR